MQVRKVIIIIAVIILLIILIGIIVAFATGLIETKHEPKGKSTFVDDEEPRQNLPINSTIDSDEVYNGTLRLITVEEWGGRPPKVTLQTLNLPVHNVIISHTAFEECETKDVCSDRVRYIQDFHMDTNGWDDIGYNFLVGGDGFVYVGRGWNSQGAHTRGYNYDSIGIAFIGTFTSVKPTANQIKATHKLIEEGVRLQKLVPDYKLYGHRQLRPTESPGEELYKIIKSWPHWTSEKPVE